MATHLVLQGPDVSTPLIKDVARRVQAGRWIDLPASEFNAAWRPAPAVAKDATQRAAPAAASLAPSIARGVVIGGVPTMSKRWARCRPLWSSTRVR